MSSTNPPTTNFQQKYKGHSIGTGLSINCARKLVYPYIRKDHQCNIHGYSDES